MTGTTTTTQISNCVIKECNKLFSYEYRNGGKKLYCSDECRSASRRASLKKYYATDKCKATFARFRNTENYKVIQKRWDDAHPNRIKGFMLTTEEDKNRLFTLQNGKCAICKKSKKLVIDHDHATLLVRGLLCLSCNLKMAAIDDKEFMENAPSYVTASVFIPRVY